MILRGYLMVYSVVGLVLLATCNAISKKPTVLISVLVRNKAHTLPYFLSLLERQDYPKKRISLWIRSDNNVDNSIKILNKWISTRSEMYHSLNVDLNASSTGFEDEKSIANWSPRRFAHVIDLREQALDYARKIWADFIWMLDADVFLTNPSTIRNLVHKRHTVVAPLLRSDGMYSNFWAGMTAEHYYLRTELYEPILFREKIGCHDVPMIHSAVFIDLRRRYSDRLTYKAEKLTGYDGPVDDIITFAIGANKSDVPLFVCNDDVYGFVMVPLENDETIAEDMQRLTNTKVEMLSFSDYLPLSDDLKEFVMYPEKDTLGLDHIYMINLLRRPERRKRMQRLFEELGIRAEIIDAVDGRYMGRKRLVKSESLVEGSKFLVRAGYSYWTLGYILSESGAKKLIGAMPLGKLIPVDEFLPILSDTHPKKQWVAQFPTRDLIILSTNPLLIYPTHYTGEDGHISDTEDSKLVHDTSTLTDLENREEL
ncbi:glycosyltransferase 25 family member isoform X2 [Temnothorax longispinosus]|uniref:glycosyltransferase 25 family member isoform X2 n=1 Tax=Temnothorax longispinosus TaxID=300112 RepID=UPI003A9A5612